MITDIRLKTSFPTHRKTKKLIKKLGEAGAWALVCLLIDVGVNHSDVDISDYSDEDIALASNWNGDASEFVNALLSVGFIDESMDANGDLTRLIHDWCIHNPWAASAPIRSEQACIAARKRWEHREDADCMPSAYGEHPGCSAPSPSPSPCPFPDPPLTNKERDKIFCMAETALNNKIKLPRNIPIEKIDYFCQLYAEGKVDISMLHTPIGFLFELVPGDDYVPFRARSEKEKQRIANLNSHNNGTP